jgi:hypothetical protein
MFPLLPLRLPVLTRVDRLYFNDSYSRGNHFWRVSPQSRRMSSAATASSSQHPFTGSISTIVGITGAVVLGFPGHRSDGLHRHSTPRIRSATVCHLHKQLPLRTRLRLLLTQGDTLS